MSTREQLNNYLRGLESRLRLLVVSRGIAAAFGVALGATLALVLITNAFAFSENSMLVARIALYISLAAAIGIGLVIPLLKLNQRNAAGKAEQANPDFNQRLVTYIERREVRDPMLELLAEDTLDRARKAPPTEVVPQKSIFAFSAGAGAALVALMWIILAGPGFLGFGAKTLWAGLPKDGLSAGGKYYEITVEPGDETVRRRTDVSIVATLKNFMAPEVRLMARYESSAKWEEALMLPRVGEASYGFLLAAVPEALEYYVEAAGVRSKTFKIQVMDLPGISNIKVTYHYPARLGQKDYVEDPGGDLRAVVGTVAELLVETDKPLTNGVIVMQDGTEIPLKATQGNFLTANVKIEKEGTYHFSAMNGSERVRLTQDYFIEAQGDEGPKIRITHPGLDHRANPIEEVVITAEATDDYGVNSMDLHYSVNGGAEKVVALIGNQRGTLIADGKVTLYLEDFKMVPGDVVSFYVTAKDAAVESASEIGFIEAQPFEKNYSQSQSGGGGGGGGGGAQQEQNEISRRQREIIQLTHNALRGSAQDKAAATKERASFLAEVQGKLKDQANSLANRVKARELDDESGSIKEFVKEIEAAAAEMGPAAEQLADASWQEALVPEQKALQHLQRAEQMNRDIQVAFGNQGGGGGGGGGNAGRDLANLFDLELDTEKNQYEQAEQAGSPAEQQQQQIDEALQKLQELARRQEQLAQQQRNGKQQSLDKRWEQEQLRREAEQLRRDLERMQQQQASNSQRGSEQMSRGQQGQQGQQGQSGQSGQQGQQGQSGQSGQSGQQSASQQQVQRLLDQIKQAEEQMREAQRANQTGNESEADAAARRAAAQLQQAQNAARQMQQEGTQAGLQGLGQRADDLANRQKQVEERMRNAAQAGNNRSPQGNMTRAEAEQLAQQKDEMASELADLERDVQRQARDLAQSQPEASRTLRDGLAETQQAEARRRLEVGAEYLRQGSGAQWYRSGYETPVTRSTQDLAEAIREAQGQLQEGGQQGNENSQLARQVQDVQRLREQLERLQQQAAQQGQQGQQGGQQPGGKGKAGQEGQQGQSGQQGKEGQGGQQGQNGQGGQQGGQQPGGQQNGGGANGGYGGDRNGGNIGQYGRFGYPQGVYDRDGVVPVDPRQLAREAQRQLQELRAANRDDREMAGQIQQLERELQNLQVGNPSGPELQNRLARTILPQLETLEVQLRNELAQAEGGQVRSPATDRTPEGFGTQVQEYFRRLSRSK